MGKRIEKILKEQGVLYRGPSEKIKRVNGIVRFLFNSKTIQRSLNKQDYSLAARYEPSIRLGDSAYCHIWPLPIGFVNDEEKHENSFSFYFGPGLFENPSGKPAIKIDPDDIEKSLWVESFLDKAGRVHGDSIRISKEEKYIFWMDIENKKYSPKFLRVLLHWY
jgi:hypothetical protein